MKNPTRITPTQRGTFLASTPFAGLLTMAIAACTYHHVVRRRQKEVEVMFPDVQVCMSRREQIASALTATGLLNSQRGPGGGYLLTKPLREVTFADVVPAFAWDGAVLLSKRSSVPTARLFPERVPQALPLVDALYSSLLEGLKHVRIEEVYPDLVQRSEDVASGMEGYGVPPPRLPEDEQIVTKAMIVNAVTSVFALEHPFQTILQVTSRNPF